MRQSELTWREVFDGYKAPVYDIKDMLKLLKTTDYIYFNWNGEILEAIDDYENYRRTGLRVENLELNAKNKEI